MQVQYAYFDYYVSLVFLYLLSFPWPLASGLVF